MFFDDGYDDRYSEHMWRNESDAYEKAEIQREAREMIEFCAGDSPALTAFLEATTSDAPGGRYRAIESEGESDIEMARRRGPGVCPEEQAAVARIEAKREAVTFPHEMNVVTELHARFGNPKSRWTTPRRRGAR